MCFFGAWRKPKGYSKLNHRDNCPCLACDYSAMSVIETFSPKAKEVGPGVLTAEVYMNFGDIQNWTGEIKL